MNNKQFFSTDTIEIISWDRTLYPLEHEIIAIIILAGLYENGTITREKLMGQLQSLRKGELLKFRKTYHCTINNRWYSDEPFTEIFKDLLAFKRVSYVKLIEVLQLYNNKNYNYCINVIVNQIIQPLLNYFASQYHSYDYFSQIFITDLKDFPKIEQKGYRSECWECGNTHFSSDIRRTKEKGTEQIISFFHNYKKGNLTKNPIG